MAYQRGEQPRGITAARLRELLAGLGPDDLLAPNQVENLAILRRDAEGRWCYVGFVNVGSEAIEPFDEGAEGD